MYPKMVMYILRDAKEVQSVARGKDEPLPQREQMKVVAENLKGFCCPQADPSMGLSTGGR